MTGTRPAAASMANGAAVVLARRQRGRFPSRAGDHQAFGALRDLPFHEHGEGALVEPPPSVGERRHQGRERAAEPVSTVADGVGWLDAIEAGQGIEGPRDRQNRGEAEGLSLGVVDKAAHIRERDGKLARGMRKSSGSWLGARVWWRGPPVRTRGHAHLPSLRSGRPGRDRRLLRFLGLTPPRQVNAVARPRHGLARAVRLLADPRGKRGRRSRLRGLRWDLRRRGHPLAMGLRRTPAGQVGRHRRTDMPARQRPDHLRAAGKLSPGTKRICRDTAPY